MADFEKHTTVLFARILIDQINKKKLPNIDKLDRMLLDHVMRSKIKEYDVVKLIDETLGKYITLFDSYGIPFKSLATTNAEKTGGKPVFGKISIYIDPTSNMLEIRLPFLTREKFNPLIEFLRDELEMTFEKRKDVDPVWFVLVRHENLYDELLNNSLVKNIGYVIDQEQLKQSLERITEDKKTHKKLFQLSKTANLGFETTEFKGMFQKLYPFQQVSVEYSKFRNGIFIADDMGLGKMESVNNRLFTPNGRRRIGDMKIGDKVIGSSGQSTSIIGVYPQGKKELYRVYFNDNTSVLVGKEHLWTVSRAGESRWKVISTEQMLDNSASIEFNGIGHNSSKKYNTKTYFKDGKNNQKYISFIDKISIIIKKFICCIFFR